MLRRHNGWLQKRACADLYIVPVAVHEREPHEATRKKNNKTPKHKPETQQLDSDALSELTQQLSAENCAGHLESKQKQTQKMARGRCGSNKKHVAETQDPPSQDPGDHNVKPKDNAPIPSEKMHQSNCHRHAIPPAAGTLL